MATTWKAPTWRMPNDKNQSKFESYSIDFNGMDPLNCGNSDTLNIASSNHSISTWVKYTTDTNQVVCEKGTNNQLALQIGGSGNQGKISWIGGADYVVTSANTINDGNWHHVCCVAYGSSSILYIDGQISATGGSKTVNANTSNFMIGGRGTSYHFTGSMSQLCLFDYDLSSAQVRSLYNLGSPINPMILKPAPIASYLLGRDASTGGSSTLSVPNVAVPDASVFDFDNNPTILFDDNFFTPSGTVGGTGNFMQVSSISWWMKSSRSGSYSVIFPFDANNAWMLRIDNLGNMWFFAGAGTTYVKFNNVTANSINLCDSQWHHCVFTIPDANDKNQCKFFIDNQEITSTTTAGLSTGYGVHYIMTKLKLAGGYLGDIEGTQISNLQVWLNTALGNSDINTIYNDGQPLLTGTQPQEANLKAWYKLDQSANWEADTAGEWQIPDAMSSYPQSFDFGENNNEVFVVPKNALEVTSAITLSCWVKTDVSTSRQTMIAAYQSDNNNNKCYVLGVYGRYSSGYTAPGVWLLTAAGEFIAFTDVSPSGITGLTKDSNIGIITDNKWHNVVFTWDGTTNTNALKLFVDGKLYAQATSDFTGPINTSSSIDYRLGSTSARTSGSGSQFYFRGQMSNVQVWQESLTSTGASTVGDIAGGQVAQLYNNGVPLTTAIATDNLKAWYKLDSGVYTQGTAAAGWRIDNSKYPSSYKTAIQTHDGITNGNRGYISTPFNATGTGGSVFGSGSNLDITISFWVYPQYNNSSGIFKMGTTPSRVYPNTHLINIGIGRFQNKIGVTIITGSGSGTIIADYPIDNPSANPNPGLTLETWYHAVLTRNSSNNTWSFYLNNILIGTFDDNADLSTQAYATNVYLGNGSLNSAKAYHSNYAIWNKHLSTADRTLLYNNGRPLSDLSSLSEQPVSWWKLNNLTTGLQDSVGNNNATATDYVVVKNILVSTQAGVSSGMTEQNLVNNNVSALNGESSGMDTSNLVTSTLTRQIPYNSYSLNFDSASSDYIDCGSNILFDSTQAFSFSGWVNLDNYSPAYPTIVRLATDLTEDFIIGLSDQTNYTGVFFGARSGFVKGTTSGDISADFINTWKHVCLTYNGLNKALLSNYKIFVDGAEITLTTAGSFATSTGGVTTIGYGGYSNRLFNGKISNLSIFNEALTSTEVMKLYNSGVPGDLSSFNPQPIAWWSLGSDSYYNGANYICPDLIGTNNGTSSGMDANALVGNAPKSTANGTSANMTIGANLTGSAPNSSNNSFSVNMSFDDRETDVPS